MIRHALTASVCLTIAGMALAQVPQVPQAPASSPPKPGSRIVYVGNGLGAQMLDYGEFEVQLQMAFPSHRLSVRNLCFEGDTASYRPRSGRKDPWAFAGADQFRPELKSHRGNGIEPSADEWLTLYRADIILGFFGYNESFDGPEGVDRFKSELEAWIEHSNKQQYNGSSAPQLVLVSPMVFEDLSATRKLPDGKRENVNLKLYVEAMRQVAKAKGVAFVDLHEPTRKAAETLAEPITLNGFLPNALGNRVIAEAMMTQLYGMQPQAGRNADGLRQWILDKNWLHKQDFRILNGVHVYGRRRGPFGIVNYPPEIEKTRQMAANRDLELWAALKGDVTRPVEELDKLTLKLPEIQTNYRREITYQDREQAVASIEMMEGFKVEMFASEREFADLRNPVQMSFDNQGRLWVATVPSYPAWKPGDPRPNDKLIVFEDTDNDGRADRQTVFADGLHLPMGFELAAEGVYVSQQPDLILLKDTDGDGRADHREVILRGFDPHDTHHAIGAFCADPMGGLYMPEGIFLHSQVETAYGPRRDNWSGAWRFDPVNQRLERYSQSGYANPWGVAFDHWGQCFLADASSGQNWWELPISVKMPHGERLQGAGQFAPKRARPTSGAEFISSRHFPDEVQGGFMVNNCIGFQGTSIHTIAEDGSGFAGKHIGDLLTSKDLNFRPVDLEFAPDGSLYLIDWHNPLVGHMQHSARDPNRDHDHGRIYRITYPSRPLVKPVKIAGASIAQLLKALEEPEIRTRYRARRELRGHPAGEVVPAVKEWLASKDPSAPDFDHHLTEAMWVAAGAGELDLELLGRCLSSNSHQARAAAVDVIRFRHHEIPNHQLMLMSAANDAHPRVRLAAMVAASWVGGEHGARIATMALERPVDKWMTHAYKAALNTLREPIIALSRSSGMDLAAMPQTKAFLDGKLKLGASPPPRKPPTPKLSKADLKLYEIGREVYGREAHCATCHQDHGKGDKTYPPLAQSPWVTDDEERLIKVVLKGLWGPITIHGKTYDPKNGVPPMTPFEFLLDDQELAGVLTYVRNSFGNKAPAVKPETVKKVRAAEKGKQGFYMVEELLKEHPMK